MHNAFCKVQPLAAALEHRLAAFLRKTRVSAVSGRAQGLPTFSIFICAISRNSRTYTILDDKNPVFITWQIWFLLYLLTGTNGYTENSRSPLRRTCVCNEENEGENAKLITLATKNTKLYKKCELREFILGDFHYRDPSLTWIPFSLSQKEKHLMFS